MMQSQHLEWSGTLAIGALCVFIAGATFSYLSAAWQAQESEARPWRSTKRMQEPCLSRSQRALEAFILLKYPLSAVALKWYVALNTEAALTRIPALFSSYGTALDEVLPIHVRTFSQAFELGRLFKMLEDLPSNEAASARHPFELGRLFKIENDLPSRETEIASILQQAGQVVGRVVSLAELREARITLLEQDDARSLGSRVIACFSLVNFVWLCSIIGLTVLFMPFLEVVFRPIFSLLMSIWREVIRPMLVALKPLREPLLYFVTLLVMMESARLPRGADKESMTGTMIAVTSLALFCASWCFSTYLHCHRDGDISVWQGVSGLLTAVAGSALAILHQSSLLGFIAVGAFCAAFGFTAIGSPLCICIGFSDLEECIQTAAACLFLTLSRAALRAVEVKSHFIAPFNSAIDIFGTSVYFLALSILSYHETRGKLLYYANLASYLLLGMSLGLEGMVNTAKVWASIELLVLYCTFFPKSNSSEVTVFLFSLCVITYLASLYLNTHPELVVAAYSSGSSS